MFPPSSSAQVGLSSLPRGLAAASAQGFGLAALFRWAERFDSAGQRHESLRTTFLLDWRAHDKLTLVAVQPYVRDQARSGGVAASAAGHGDLALLAKVSLWRDGKLLSREALLIAGLELPTGFNQARDAQGRRLPMTLQPGSDSLDFLAGLAGVWSLWSVAFYGDVLYKRNGREAYAFGDAFSADAGLTAPFSFAPELGASLELNFEHSRRDRSVLLRGDVPGTGGETLYLSPSLQWRPRDSLALAAGLQAPVYQRLRGGQLRSRVNPLASLSLRF